MPYNKQKGKRKEKKATCVVLAYTTLPAHFGGRKPHSQHFLGALVSLSDSSSRLVSNVAALAAPGANPVSHPRADCTSLLKLAQEGTLAEGTHPEKQHRLTVRGLRIL